MPIAENLPPQSDVSPWLTVDTLIEQLTALRHAGKGHYHLTVNHHEYELSPYGLQVHDDTMTVDLS